MVALFQNRTSALATGVWWEMRMKLPQMTRPASSPNPLKPVVKSITKMQSEQHRQAMLQLHLSDQQIYCPLGYIYIRGLTVFSFFGRKAYTVETNFLWLVPCHPE